MMNAEERLKNWRRIRAEKFIKMIGLFSAHFGEAILKRSGYETDFKINGIPMDRFIKINALDIKEQLELAIREERFEDAVLLRDRIKQLTSEGQKAPEIK